MLRARVAAWFRPDRPTAEPEGRQAYHSDIRELRPEAWATGTPEARGSDVEQAMWLAGVTSKDFADLTELGLAPHLVTPVDDIVTLCRRRAAACEQRARELSSVLPPPDEHGRPPLPWHRNNRRQAEALDRAAHAWDSLARALLSNRWDG